MAKRQQISEDGLVFPHPMASNVSDQVIKEEEAAACRLGTFHWITLWIPVMEVIIPIIPAKNA